jgi:hypothetical protein
MIQHETGTRQKKRQKGGERDRGERRRKGQRVLAREVRKGGSEKGIEGFSQDFNGYKKQAGISVIRKPVQQSNCRLLQFPHTSPGSTRPLTREFTSRDSAKSP